MSGAEFGGNRRRTVASPFLLLVLAMVVAAASPGIAQPPKEFIVGGPEAGPTEFPVVVALVRSAEPNTYRGQFCGGTLVHPEWVVTAGHCVEGRSPSYLEVYVGDYDLKGDGERIPVDEIHLHPGFDGGTLVNDIALLRLDDPAVDAPGLGDTARLPLEGDIRHFDSAEIVTIVGWGFTEGEPDGAPDFPRRLRKASVPVRSTEECNAAYAGFSFPHMICAGFDEGGADSCQGDSGGPMLATMGDGSYLLVGIVSWGVGCADAGFFGVYTRTATHACWIAETMANGTLGYGKTTIVGTSGPDTIDGTNGPDIILGLGGDDLLRGGGGSDALCGGEGNDRLIGGRKPDLLDGGPGADVIKGNKGADVGIGGDGDDLLRGFSGGDALVGDGGADRILGHEGDDRLQGSAGQDLIKGGTGHDRIEGGPADDVLRGNRGDDLIFGNGGTDTVVGGGGFDTCVGEFQSSCEA